jgi:hypothetical protein
MNKEEPPPEQSARSRSFRIGRDSRGNWVARDGSGLRGGLFVDCEEALRFALFESGKGPRAVIMVPGVLELDIGEKPTPASDRMVDSPRRQVA